MRLAGGSKVLLHAKVQGHGAVAEPCAPRPASSGGLAISSSPSSPV